ncbi:MAG: LysR family transcriptional regulator [Alphaproteobacteria bacterium]|nr:MAG: LysR family transcriptional regulator [Alphaproteobacteria bacterium]
MNLALNHPVPLLELDLLRTFVAIVDTGSFAGAASAVFRTPSAVSMQIKKLEDLLGKPVLVRDSRSVSLTREGEMLLEHARRVLALNRETMARFIQPDIAGEVRLGTPDDVAERFLPEMLRRFADSHCGVTVNVIVAGSGELSERVRQRQVDLALITCEAGIKGVEASAEILFRERLVWACAKGGVAAEQDPLPVSVWEEGCIWRKAGLSRLEAQGRDYRIAFLSAHISGQRAAVLADLAVAPIPSSALNGMVVEADPKYGLPELPEYALGMIVAENASAPVLAAADHLRASFAAMGK